MPSINLPKRSSRKRVSTTAKKEAQSIYQDKRWKITREEKLRLNPLCERCEAKDRSKFAEEVHHKIPFMSAHNKYMREMLAFDIDNLESLCVDCHKLEHSS